MARDGRASSVPIKMKEKSTMKTIKNQSSWRWGILLASTTVLLSIYYCYDIPSALKPQLSSYMKHTADYEVQFGLLYSIYSSPNVGLSIVSSLSLSYFVGSQILMLLFAGAVVDRYYFLLGGFLSASCLF
jgi:hypothetical protein